MLWKNLLNFLRKEFNFWGIFVFGFVFGCIFCTLIYFLFVIKNFNKSINKCKIKNDDLTDEKMNKLIQETQIKFKKDIKENKKEYISSLLNNSKILTLQIVKSFYPDSPYPYLELTIDETLVLIQYLHKRIDELFNKKIISILKKITLRRIFVLRKKIIDKKYVEKYKKTKKIKGYIFNAVNFLNPFYWVKKFIFDSFYNILLSKIGCAIILIVGEEVYKVYSKKLFKSDQDLNNLVNELQEEIKKQNQK